MSKITIKRIGLGAAILVAAIGGAVASAVAQQQPTPVPWSGCCGWGQWPMMGPGMMGHGMMGWGMMGQRYGTPMMTQIPAPYNSIDEPAAENP